MAVTEIFREGVEKSPGQPIELQGLTSETDSNLEEWLDTNYPDVPSGSTYLELDGEERYVRKHTDGWHVL